MGQGAWRTALAAMLIAAALLLASPPASRGEVRLGVQGGPVWATQVLSSDEGDEGDERGFDIGTRTGFSVGFVLDVDLGSRVWLRLAPGWAERGSTFTLELFWEEHRGRFELGYVELPVTLSVALTSGTVRPYVTGGGTIGSLARARMVAIREDGEESEDAGEFFEDWDFGLTCGAGLVVVGKRTRGFVEGRYTWGLSDLWVEDTGGSLKNRGWQLLVGVTFGL